MKRALSINDLIQQVRDELHETALESQMRGKAPLFLVNKLTIEVNFVVAESSMGKGGASLKIVTAEGSKEYNEKQVHKITLELMALDTAQLISKASTKSKKPKTKFDTSEILNSPVEKQLEILEKIISGERYFTM